MASGLADLTGEPGAPTPPSPGEPASAARGAGLALAALTTALATAARWATPVEVDGGRLLSERAALLGLRPRGAVSPNGSCRMVRAGDGWLAVNLARPADVALLDAWLEAEVAGVARPAARPAAGPWTPEVAAALDAACARRSAAELADRAGLMGLPVARVPADGATIARDAQSRARAQGFPPEPWRIHPGPSRPSRSPPPAGDASPWPATAAPGEAGRRPLVVDLSSLWAGPLCAHLLGRAGCEVVTVESARRPDPSRLAAPAFHDRLHRGHRRTVVDLGDAAGRGRLADLMASAAVVIEGSRPRALDQLGIGPASVLARSPATVWVSITGYGRTGPWSNRVAFGDDAAAAAGLVARALDDRPLFCGDAVADPLAGLHAAVAATAMLAAGRGGLVDVALRDVAASTMARPDPDPS